jgi:hypothetical protein
MAELLALSEAETEDCLSDMVSINQLAVQGLKVQYKAVLWIRMDLDRIENAAPD